MPKTVDHEQRRIQIIDAIWSLIGDGGGFHAATMRDIAAQAGFANGALKHYFQNKSEMLAAAYGRAFDLAEERMQENMAGLTGIAALRGFCLEMMPLDDERATKSRVVLAFWDSAVNDPKLAEIHQRMTLRWVERLHTCVEQGRAAGEIEATMSDDQIVDEILTLTMGLQAVPLLLGGRFTTDAQLAMIDGVLDRLRRP